MKTYGGVEEEEEEYNGIQSVDRSEYHWVVQTCIWCTFTVPCCCGHSQLAENFYLLYIKSYRTW
jgi:hypothetical protein